MKFLRKFNEHTSYEAELNVGGQDFEIPNVSYCKDANDVHFNPYNLIEFYVGNITGTTQQTVKIYTDSSTSIDVSVSDGNKWYSYLLPKDKGLYKIEGDSVKNVVVKANITTSGYTIIPPSTVEASFKGSNTSNVTRMDTMFQDCSGLTSLDLSSFDTSNVTDMDSMFYNCASLTSLDVSNFDTSNVTNMFSMFFGCSSLTSLDVSNFKTTNVTNMHYMFGGCAKLTSLTLSNFDTSNVTNMYNMFDGCASLESLDLSGWNMSNVTYMNQMFDGCGSLETIKMIGCSQDTIQKITDVKPSGATIVTGQTI